MYFWLHNKYIVGKKTFVLCHQILISINCSKLVTIVNYISIYKLTLSFFLSSSVNQSLIYLVKIILRESIIFPSIKYFTFYLWVISLSISISSCLSPFFYHPVSNLLFVILQLTLLKINQSDPLLLYNPLPIFDQLIVNLKNTLRK